MLIHNIKTIRIIDLFAGIGGTRIGFEKAAESIDIKCECVFSSEWDKYAQETYKANFGDEKIFGDIREVPSNLIPEHDILLAGFPCQPFSHAGKKAGFSDTRGTLFFEIERILRDKKPKAFLLENVKRLKTHDKGRTFEIMREHLLELGYTIHHVVLKAKDFGLPQLRERIYIVGFLDPNVDFFFPLSTSSNTRVGDILETNVDEKYTISDKLWEGHQRRKKENKLKGKGFGYGIVNENTPYTNTISARYYKDGSEILIQQPNKNPRKLTPREASRLQGYPDTFKIPVSNNQAYKQFGNSVPVNVVQAIAEEMLKSAFNDKQQ